MDGWGVDASGFRGAVGRLFLSQKLAARRARPAHPGPAEVGVASYGSDRGLLARSTALSNCVCRSGPASSSQLQVCEQADAGERAPDQLGQCWRQAAALEIEIVGPQSVDAWQRSRRRRRMDIAAANLLLAVTAKAWSAEVAIGPDRTAEIRAAAAESLGKLLAD